MHADRLLAKPEKLRIPIAAICDECDVDYHGALEVSGEWLSSMNRRSSRTTCIAHATPMRPKP
jgi:hypothetical protein